MRQITRDEPQHESKQGRGCEEGQGLAARQMGEQQEMERTGVTETGGLGEQDGRSVQTDREEGTTDEGGAEGSAERERRGDWSHLYGPEFCSACERNPFECGCLNVSFESKGEKKRRERREREREVWNKRRIGSSCPRVANQATSRVGENGCAMSEDVGHEAGEKRMDWEWEKRAELDLVDHLRDLREEMAEMALRVGRLECAVVWEGSGSSRSSGGSGWAW